MHDPLVILLSRSAPIFLLFMCVGCCGVGLWFRKKLAHAVGEAQFVRKGRKLFLDVQTCSFIEFNKDGCIHSAEDRLGIFSYAMRSNFIGVPFSTFLSNAAFHDVVQQVQTLLQAEGGESTGQFSVTYDGRDFSCVFRMLVDCAYGGVICIVSHNEPELEKSQDPPKRTVWNRFPQPLLSVSNAGVMVANPALIRWRDDYVPIEHATSYCAWLGESFATWLQSCVENIMQESTWYGCVSVAGEPKKIDVIATVMQPASHLFGCAETDTVILFVEKKAEKQRIDELAEVMHTAGICTWTVSSKNKDIDQQGFEVALKELAVIKSQTVFRKMVGETVWHDIVREFSASRKEQRVFCIHLDGALFSAAATRSYVIYGRHLMDGAAWLGTTGIVQSVEGTRSGEIVQSRLFNALCEHIPAGIFVRRCCDGALLAWNAALCRILEVDVDYAKLKMVLETHAEELGLTTMQESTSQSSVDRVKTIKRGANQVIDIRLKTVPVAVPDQDAIVMGLVSKVALLSDVTASRAQPATTVKAQNTRPKHVVLVVDDDESVRIVIQRMLEPEGYEVILAKNIENACAHAENYGARIDLMILSMKLRGANPQQMVDRISMVIGHDVPVVFCSSFFAGDVKNGQLGATHARVIEKPFKRDTLISAVTELLD